MTPGSNLFLRALRLIKPTEVDYLAANGRTLNTARQWVPQFAAPVTIKASVQVVARSAYHNLGLDFQKNYIKIFVAAHFVNLARDTSGDRFVVNGKAYQINDQNDWFVQDGWASCMAVEVGPFPGAVL
jgi:hypothetical protein